MTSKSNEMKNPQREKNNNQHHKNPLRVLLSKYHRWEFYWDSSQVKLTTWLVKTTLKKYDLTKVPTACTPMNWPKDSQKHDLDPLAGKKFYWDSSQVKFSMQSWKLRSKVWFKQGAHSGHLFGMVLWLEKTTLKSIKWLVYMDHVHLFRMTKRLTKTRSRSSCR